MIDPYAISFLIATRLDRFIPRNGIEVAEAQKRRSGWNAMGWRLIRKPK